MQSREEQIKDWIEIHEYRNNGMAGINGAYVEVTKLDWDDEEATATVELHFPDDGKIETYTDCNYPLEEIRR